MSAGLGLNAQSLSALDDATADDDARSRDRANSLDEATIQARSAQREKERQEARLVNRFMSRTISGGDSSDTASSAGGSDSITSSRYSGMTDSEILDDMGMEETDDFSSELGEDKHLRRALDQLTDRLRSGAEEVEICLMEEIHSVDTARDVVNKHLLRRVLDHYDDFMRGMDHVSDVDLDLTRACIHARNARRSLAQTKQSMVYQLLNVAKKKRERARLLGVRRTMEFVQEMSNIPQKIHDLIRSENFVDAVTTLRDAEVALGSSMSSKLLCLRTLKPQLREMWPYLRKRIDLCLRDLIASDIAACAEGRSRGGASLSLDTHRYRHVMESYMHLDLTMASDPDGSDGGDVSGEGGGGRRRDSVDSVVGYDSGEHAYLSQYAGVGPLENEGGVEGTPGRLQRIYLSLVEDQIRKLVVDRIAAKEKRKEEEDEDEEEKKEKEKEKKKKDTTNNPFGDDDADSRPATPSRRIRSSSSMIEQAQSTFREQCHRLTPDDVVALTFDMYASMFDLMYHHKKVLEWHVGQQAVVEGQQQAGKQRVSLEELMSDETMIHGLASTSPILWRCCHDRLSHFLNFVHMSFPSFRLDHATQLYNATVLFVSQEEQFYDPDPEHGGAGATAADLLSSSITVGLGAQWADEEDRDGSGSGDGSSHPPAFPSRRRASERIRRSTLVRSVQQRIMTYLGSFQRDAYEVLSDFIQRETWDRLELSLEDMGGIDGLVGRRQHVGALRQSSRMVRRLSLQEKKKKKKKKKKKEEEDDDVLLNPFDVFSSSATGVEVVGEDEEEDEEDEEEDEEDEDEKEGKKETPLGNETKKDDDFEFTPLTSVERVITTSALNGFTKYIGDYLNIMEHLPAMSSIAARGLFQLFDFYVNSVVVMFTKKEDLEHLLSDRDPEDLTTDPWSFSVLAQLVRRVRLAGGSATAGGATQRGGGGEGGGGGGGGTAGGGGGDDVSSAALRSTQGMMKMTSATESVRFLLEMCQALRSNIQQKLGGAASTTTRAMFDDAETITQQLRDFMYVSWTRRAIPSSIVLDSMKTKKWDPKDLPETFSPYVTIVVDHLVLTSNDMRSKAPPHIHTLLWKHMVERTMRCLLDAYGTIKKCTNNGRAQMSLDLATLQRSIDQQVSGTSNCPGAVIANMFIKAYYYDSAMDFVSWMETPEQDLWGLSLRHLLSLVSCDKSPLSKLKTKQKKELKAKVMTIWTHYVQKKMDILTSGPPPPPPPRPNGV